VPFLNGIILGCKLLHINFDGTQTFLPQQMAISTVDISVSYNCSDYIYDYCEIILKALFLNLNAFCRDKRRFKINSCCIHFKQMFTHWNGKQLVAK
jgi:hypothetical protein